jgi:hypothetical protein
MAPVTNPQTCVWHLFGNEQSPNSTQLIDPCDQVEERHRASFGISGISDQAPGVGDRDNRQALWSGQLADRVVERIGAACSISCDEHGSRRLARQPDNSIRCIVLKANRSESGERHTDLCREFADIRLFEDALHGGNRVNDLIISDDEHRPLRRIAARAISA